MATTTPDAITAATRTTIERFNEAFNRHHVDDIMALMTDDCIFDNTEPAPDGTRYEGQAAVRDAWARLFAQSPQARFETEEIFCSGDRGVVRWLYRWVDANGAPGHVRGVDIMTVRDGKVAAKLSYVKG